MYIYIKKQVLENLCLYVSHSQNFGVIKNLLTRMIQIVKGVDIVIIEHFRDIQTPDKEFNSQTRPFELRAFSINKCIVHLKIICKF